MFIEQITIQNIKSYGADPTTVKFGEGVNLIAGENGAGKSTILEAIGFVLFDALPYNQGDFQRRGKSGTSKVTVRLRSVYDDRPYDIERAIPTRYKVTDFEENVDLGIESKDELLAWLRQHFKVETTADLSALFNNAIGVQQGTITAVFLDTPARRKPTFDALLRVQDYDDAWVTLRETAGYIDTLINKNAQGIARKESTIEQLSSVREKAVELEHTIGDDKTTYEENSETLTSLQEEVERLETLKEQTQERERLQNDLSDIEAKKTSQESLIDEIKPKVAERVAKQKTIEELEEKRKKLDDDIEARDRKREELNKDVQATEEAFENAEKRLREYQQLQDEIERLENDKQTEIETRSDIEKQLQRRVELDDLVLACDRAIHKVESQKTQAETTINNVKGTLKDLHEMRAMLSKEGAVCPVCRQSMDGEAHAEAFQYYDDEEKQLTSRQEEARDRLEDAAAILEKQTTDKATYETERDKLANVQALEAANKRIDDREGEISENRDKLAEMDAVPDEYKASEEAYGQAKDTLEQHDEQVKKFWEERQQLADEIAELSRQIADLPSENDLERQEKELNDILQKIEDKRNALFQLKELPEYDEAHHNKTKKEYKDLRDVQASLKTTIEMNKKRLRELWEGIEMLDEAERELEQLQGKAEQLEDEKIIFDFVRSSIREAGPRIRERKVQFVSQIASSYFSEILNDLTMHLHWNADDYGIYIEQGGETRAFNVLSGGEQMIAALSVRLALLTHMTRVRLIFLDEPTINLDGNRRIQLAEHLSQIRNLQQLFVISHDDTFIEESNHVIRIVKEDGLSRVVN